MSYILEALKKAQAERQLGSAPTIHAPVAPAAPASIAGRTPVIAGVAAGCVLVAAALLMWRQQAAPVAAPAPAGRVATVMPAPVAKAVSADKPVAPAPQVALVGQADPPAKPATPDTPVAAKPAAPAIPAVTRPAPAVVAHAGPAPVTIAGAAAVSAAAPAQPVPAAVPPANADDALGGLNSLPEAVRLGVPKVAFGGYMYSPNPADRLVLVDNILRREGEEVAPGLVLEKLLPKGAVMNYRGNRYRVAF